MVDKSWKQPTCPSKEEWREKMWFLHTREYYAALKKDKLGSFVGT